MTRGLHRLAPRSVTTAKAGRHSDGGGLYLVVDKPTDGDKPGARRWAFMYWQGRKGSEIGLGSPMKGVTLPKARERAAECRRLLAEGGDPRQWNAAAKPVPDFQTMAEDVIASLESGWRNEKHTDQWRSTVKTYCKPIASTAINKIGTEDVLKVLRPIWETKAETASRLRGRIERILDAAKAKGHREGENPARWRGHLDKLLAKQIKLTRGHHASMPWTDVPAFIVELRQREAMAAKALEFSILTAARTGEALGALWSEIDLNAKVWTLPAIRMKAGREHRVPLSDRAITILKELEKAKTGALVFPGRKVDTQLSGMSMEMLLRRMDANAYTVHGFRSSFKTWATEATSFPNELSEQALAHVTGNQVERAYRRTDVLERRRKLMDAWARYVGGGNVVPMRKVGT